MAAEARSVVVARKPVVPVYQEMVDEQLVDCAKGGDEFAAEYLINKYRNFVRVKA